MKTMNDADISKLMQDVHPRSMQSYFLGLATNLAKCADDVRGYCYHPQLTADQIEYVVNHLVSFATHPDCASLDQDRLPWHRSDGRQPVNRGDPMSKPRANLKQT